MDRQALFVLSLIITLIFFFIQRADPSRKKAVEYFGWFVGMLIVVYVWWYRTLWEAVLGLLIALVLNGLFWVLIGRYNPVSSSDDIRVMGLDD